MSSSILCTHNYPYFTELKSLVEKGSKDHQKIQDLAKQVFSQESTQAHESCIVSFFGRMPKLLKVKALLSAFEGATEQVDENHMKTLYQLFLKLGPKEQAAVLQAQCGLALSAAARSGHVECLKRMLSQLTAHQIVYHKGAEAAAYSPLANAVAGGNRICLRLMIQKLASESPQLRYDALRQTTGAYNALHYAASEAKPKALADLKLLMQGFSRLQLRQLMLQVVQDGSNENLLHQVAKSGCPKTFLMVLQMIPKPVRERAFYPDNAGRTPLHHAAASSSLDLFKMVYKAVGDLGDHVRLHCLVPSHGGTGILAEAAPGFLGDDVHQEVVDLLFQLNDWELMLAMGRARASTLSSKSMKGFMSNRFPKENQQVNFFLMRRCYLGVPFKVDIYANRSIESRLLEQLIGTPSTRLFHALPSFIKNPLNTYGASLHLRFQKAQSDEERAEIQYNIGKNQAWLQHICPLLYSSYLSDKEKQVLVPLLCRLQTLASAGLRMRLTTQLIRVIFASESSLDFLLKALSSKRSKKSPLLHLIALARLHDRKVSEASISTIRKLMASGAYYEGSSSGMAALSALNRLAEKDQLERPVLTILTKHLASSKDKAVFLRNCRSLEQALEIGPLDFLRRGCMDPKTLRLEDVAQDCFRELLPMPTMTDFLDKYQQHFASHREPGALLAYASSLQSAPWALELLGGWVHSVFKGKDGKQRYKASKNAHLGQLYQLNPGLKKALSELCVKVGKSKVGDLSSNASSSSSNAFTFDKAKITEKVLEDRHLDHRRFSVLVSYLQDKATASDALARLANTQPRTKDISLQRLLIQLCESKQRTQRQDLLHQAFSLAQSMEKKASIGLFYKDLEGACQVLRNQSKAAAIHQFEVSLSDHYLDLLLVGTDVQGSCQRVYNSALNHCLLGYILDGKDFPIVVKKPGSQKIEARRLLRVELEAELSDDHGPRFTRPALFLERLYSNHSSSAIDVAIVEKAIEAAKHLGMPLYVKGKKPLDASLGLVALGGIARFSYSDACSGIVSGGYRVTHMEKLYEPKQQPLISSSSI